MGCLRTKLSPKECSRRLREQVQKRTLLSRFNIFRSPTSRVFGSVSDTSFTLESSLDRFSKRLVGTLIPDGEGTLIDYAWQTGAGHIVYGDARVDETEILSFLVEWLDTAQV
jgi:hypothetical protein